MPALVSNSRHRYTGESTWLKNVEIGIARTTVTRSQAYGTPVRRAAGGVFAVEFALIIINDIAPFFPLGSVRNNPIVTVKRKGIAANPMVKSRARRKLRCLAAKSRQTRRRI